MRVANKQRFKLFLATLAATITALLVIPEINAFQGYTGAGMILAGVMVLGVFLIVVDVGKEGTK